MKKFVEVLLKRRFFVLSLVLAFTVLAGIGSKYVEVNDDLFDYLPTDTESMKGSDIIFEEFDDSKTVRLLLRDVSKEEVLNISDELNENLEVIIGVGQIVQQPDADNYLVTLEVSEDYTNEELSEVVAEAETLLEFEAIEGGIIPGTESVGGDSTGMSSLMFAITLGVIGLMILLFSKSYFDVVIIIISVGIAVLLNLGTNIFLGTISDASFSAGSLIQLAVSIDYSLFIITKYREGKNKGLALDDAIYYGMKKGSTSVVAGAVTTIAGFAALMTMKYGLGVDLGLVLAKGVLISLIVALTMIPILIKMFHKTMEKAEHKSFMPKFGFVTKGIGTKFSLFVVVAIALLAVGAFQLQSQADFVYGQPNKPENITFVEENFELPNTLVLLIDKEEVDKISEFESILLDDVDGLVDTDLENNIKPVLYYESVVTETTNLLLACSYQPESLPEGYCSQLPPVTPESASMVAESLIENQGYGKSLFESENYQRVFITIQDETGSGESDEIFDTVAEIRVAASEVFEGETILTGESAVLYDLKEVSTRDFEVVSKVSILLVFIVIMLSFKSSIIPFLLIVVIQTAIWINMSFASITDASLLFLGYLMVSSVQLGATIDYSILITENYSHARIEEKKSKIQSIKESVSKSIHPVLVSGLALSVGGFVLMLMSEGSNQELGLLIGRGALVSIVLSVIALPHFLVVFDKFIFKTKSRKKRKMRLIKQKGNS